LGFVLISILYFILYCKESKFPIGYCSVHWDAKEQNDFRATNDLEPYWTNSAFGGMPTYQLGAKYPHDYIGAIDDMLRFYRVLLIIYSCIFFFMD
jgi:hypothetical protein